MPSRMYNLSRKRTPFAQRAERAMVKPGAAKVRRKEFKEPMNKANSQCLL